MPLLNAQNLRKTYRLGRVDVPVLRGVGLSVEPGECVAILGASGSGKSTLLHLLGALDRPDARENRSNSQHELGPTISFDGRELAGAPARVLDHYRRFDVGFVFQFYHLLPELTVVENVTIGGMVAHGRVGYRRQRHAIESYAKELLDRVGLGHRLEHRPAELSGGERQRVAIARALINRPRLLLADEPTGNLDRVTGAKTLDLFSELHRLGQTTIIVTHDEATAARAQRVVRIQDGVLV